MALPAPALACGGFFCQRLPMDQAAERILFVQDGGNMTAHVQVKYQGDAKKFSWVVPTPTAPKLGVGSDTLFMQLEAATRPTFQLDVKEIGGCEHPKYERMYEGVAPAPGVSQRAKSGVEVVSQQQIGPYDSAVIRSNDPAALKNWLRTNGYEIPPKLDPMLDPYVAGKFYFVALKLQKDRATGDLQPITLRYRATKAGIPLRLTAVAAVPDMDLYVWVLGGDRAIPENYRHATINEARIDWLGGGYNYRQVVTQAANEAGGQAFVTDYAGQADIPLGIIEAKHDLRKLATLTHPVAFLREIQNGSYFLPGSQNAMAFARRYVPIPKALGANIWEPGFYSNPEQYEAPLTKLGIKVHAAKAAKELEETVVKPFRTIRRAFEDHPYLTRLYSTMSPEEMTQDPLFRFTSIMPDVKREHRATGIRDCTKVKQIGEAPVTITLSNGTRFTVDPRKRNGSGGIKPWIRRFDSGTNPTGDEAMAAGDMFADLPAAQEISQIQAGGGASLIRDNGPAIRAALARHEAGQVRGTGFACAHVKMAESEEEPTGGGELALGALFVGLFGLRRWKRK